MDDKGSVSSSIARFEELSKDSHGSETSPNQRDLHRLLSLAVRPNILLTEIFVVVESLEYPFQNSFEGEPLVLLNESECDQLLTRERRALERLPPGCDGDLDLVLELDE